MASSEVSAPSPLPKTNNKPKKSENAKDAAQHGQIATGLAHRRQLSARQTLPALNTSPSAQADILPPPPPAEAKEGQESRAKSKQRYMRKRSHSFTEGNFKGLSGVTSSKRWRQRYKKSGSVSISNNNNSSNSNASSTGGHGGHHYHYSRRRILRSKFLLGGNIRDPLNLNGLGCHLSKGVATMATPESSPMPTPKHRKPEYKVEVLIPPNIADPLNLQQEVDENEFQAQLISPKFRSSKRKRKRNNKVATKLDLDKANDDGKESEKDHGEEEDKDDEEDNDIENVEEDKPDDNDEKEQKKTDAKSILTPAKTTTSPKTKPTTISTTTLNTTMTTTTKTDTTKSHNSVSESNDLLVKSTSTKETTGVDLKKSLSQPDGEGVHCVEGDVEDVKVAKKKGGSDTCPKTGSKATQQMTKTTSKSNRRRWSHRRDGNRQRVGGNKFTRPNFREKNKRYEYGNYDRYYGYRIPEGGSDSRLRYLRCEWFENRDVLDIGCNVGTVTCAVAQYLRPRLVVGMDIDKSLIEKAKKNAKMLASRKDPSGGEAHFPINLPLVFGPLDPLADLKPPPIDNEEGNATNTATNTTTKRDGVADVFPHNVKFVCSNYVLESDDLLEMAQPEFDVVLCLSTTKWIHLNFGDEGLKRAFKRIYAQLRPGGMLVLEAQPWSSYSKRKTLTERIYDNYSKIKLKPEHFADYLLHEVGFGSSQTMAIPTISPQGFHRPIQIFVKRLKTSSWQTPSSRYATPYPDTVYPLPHPPPICYAPSLTPNYHIRSTPYSPSYSYHTPNYLPSLEERTNEEDSNFFSKPTRRPSDYSPRDTPPVATPTPPRPPVPSIVQPSPESSVVSTSASVAKENNALSPVYTGPPPELMSGQYDMNNSYAPSSQSNTPVCSPHCSTTENSIQQAEISGNTTPHPGVSEPSPSAADPTYLWYGNNSSGNNTPRENNEEGSSNPVTPVSCSQDNDNVASPQ